MVKYDQGKLSKRQRFVLDLYIEKIRKIRQGKVPSDFHAYTKLLKQSLSSFPESEKTKYEKLCNEGELEYNFLKASEVIERLEPTEKQRKKIIDDFLHNLED